MAHDACSGRPTKDRREDSDGRCIYPVWWWWAGTWRHLLPGSQLQGAPARLSHRALTPSHHMSNPAPNALLHPQHSTGPQAHLPLEPLTARLIRTGCRLLHGLSTVMEAAMFPTKTALPLRGRRAFADGAGSAAELFTSLSCWNQPASCQSSTCTQGMPRHGLGVGDIDWVAICWCSHQPAHLTLPGSGNQCAHNVFSSGPTTAHARLAFQPMSPAYPAHLPGTGSGSR